MKRINILLLILALLMLAVLGLAACGETGNAPDGEGDGKAPDDGAHAHTWGAWTVVAEATCETAGSEERTCACGEKQTNPLSPLGHDEQPHEAKTPTCTEGGWNAYVTCSRCDHTTYEELGAKGHDEQPHEAKTPMCTEGGWNAYVTCSRCSYTTYEELGAKGHDEQPHEEKEPPCTEGGWNAYVTCSRCSYTTYEELGAKGHDEQPHEAKTPTCTEGGWDAYVTCSRCDYSTYAERGALGHDETPHAAQDPKCTKIGWDAYVTCSRCDYSTYAERGALGHDETPHAAQAPTCTQIGWDAYVTCSRCNYSTYAELPASHSFSTDWQYTDEVHYHACTRTGCMARSDEGEHVPNDTALCTVCGHQGKLPPPVWQGNVATAFAGGSGTFRDPYLIANGDQLALLATLINSDKNNIYHDRYYRLTNDIDLGGLEWTPIGTYYYSGSSYSSNCTFTGVFDGNGHTVSHFKITQVKNGNARDYGLFGKISGTVKDLGIKDVTVNLTLSPISYVGGLAGTMSGVALNCYAEGATLAVNASNRVEIGGLFGTVTGKMTGCHASATLEVSGNATAGGLVGSISKNGYAYGCYATGSVRTTDGTATAGGLAGLMSGDLYTSYATVSVEVTSTGAVYAGGLIGRISDNGASVRDCHAKGDLNVLAGTDVCAGGLIGYAGSTFVYTAARCFATGNVTAVGDTVFAGSFIGDALNTDLSNCYATGDVAVTATTANVTPFTGASAIRLYGCYYYEGLTVTVNVSSGLASSSAIAASAATLNSADFHRTTLELDATIWNVADLDVALGKGLTLVIKPHVHTEQRTEGTAPKCAETGISDWIYCTECGLDIQPRETLPAKGHDGVYTPYRAPTCYQPGATESMRCSDCGETVIPYRDLAMLQHVTFGGRCILCGRNTNYLELEEPLDVDSDLVLGEDGRYTTKEGDLLLLAVNAPLSYYQGYTLIEFMQDSLDWMLETAEWRALIASVDDDGYVPLTENAMMLAMDFLWTYYGDDYSLFGLLVRDMSGGAHTHSYTVTTTAPTCTARGVSHYVCTSCDAEYTLHLPTTGHNYEDGTCTACGTKRSTVWSGEIGTGFAGGSGTEEDPYLIANGEQLAYLAYEVNYGDGPNTMRGRYFALCADIDLGRLAFDPIGCGFNADGTQNECRQFVGHFDGRGHTISNLVVTASQYEYYQNYGLFGITRGSVKDLSVENFEIHVAIWGFIYAGGIAGNGYSATFENCHTKGNIHAVSQGESVMAGGIVGFQGENFTNCSFVGSIVSDANAHSELGGIAGYTMGNLTACHATVTLAATRLEGSIGGLVGVANGSTLDRCFARGLIVVEGDGMLTVGGLVATHTLGDGITDCYTDVDIEVRDNRGTAAVGGLVGDTDCEHISNCFTVGDINVTFAGDRIYISRLVGTKDNPDLVNCYYYAEQSALLNGATFDTIFFSISTDELNSANFYTEKMRWNADEWDLSALDFEKGLTPVPQT